MSNLQPRKNSVFYIYNMFKYYLFYTMRERDLEKCWYTCHCKMNNNNPILYFKAASRDGDRKYNVSITLKTGTYKYDYIDELIDVFELYQFCEFEISDYDYITDEFNIVFKRVFHKDISARIYTYSVCNYGLELKDIKEKYCCIPLCERIYNDYIDGIMTRPELEYAKVDAKSLCDTYMDTLHYNIDSELNAMFESTISDLTINDIRRQLQLPSFTPVPTLSKSPIFNEPATICYWNDGTKTVVKCQEGDTYSPEAGLALCYMKKILGNTSKDLNKELHKYIPEEKED